MKWECINWRDNKLYPHDKIVSKCGCLATYVSDDIEGIPKTIEEYSNLFESKIFDIRKSPTSKMSTLCTAFEKCTNYNVAEKKFFIIECNKNIDMIKAGDFNIIFWK